MIYKVRIVEYLEKEVEVEASNAFHAEALVREAYLNDEYDTFLGEVHVDAIGVYDGKQFSRIT